MLEVYTMRRHPAAAAASNTFREPARLVVRVALRLPRIRKARCTTTSAPSTRFLTSSRLVTSPRVNSARVQPCLPGSKGRRAMARIEPTPGRPLQLADERPSDLAGGTGDRDPEPGGRVSGSHAGSVSCSTGRRIEEGCA